MAQTCLKNLGTVFPSNGRGIPQEKYRSRKFSHGCRSRTTQGEPSSSVADSSASLTQRRGPFVDASSKQPVPRAFEFGCRSRTSQGTPSGSVSDSSTSLLSQHSRPHVNAAGKQPPLRAFEFWRLVGCLAGTPASATPPHATNRKLSLAMLRQPRECLTLSCR